MRTRFAIIAGILGSMILPLTVAQCQTGNHRVEMWRRMAAEYPAEVEKARATGIPLSLKYLRKPLPPESENAALLYKKLRNLHAPIDAIRILSDFSYLNHPTLTQVQQAQKALPKCAELLRVFHEAATRPKCVFDRAWNFSSMDSNIIPEFSQVSTAHALLISESLLLAHAGKGVEAVRNLTPGFQVARQIASDGTLDSLVAGQSVGARTLAGMRRILAVRKDATTAHAVERAVEQEWTPLPLASAMAEQAAFQQDEIQIARKEGLLSFIQEMNSPTEGTSTAKMGRGMEGMFSKEMRSDIQANQKILLDANAALLLRGMRKLKEAADLSYPKAMPIFAAFERDEATPPSMPEDQRVLRVLPVTPLFSKVIEHKASSVAMANSLRAGAAVLAYQAEHGGNLPETLDLVISPVPPDPFSGQPLHYRIEGTGKNAGFVVYSVGPDGTFDGGKPGAKMSGSGFRYPTLAPTSYY
jgi:hypothetical protein